VIGRVFHFIYGMKEQEEEFPLVHYVGLRSCLETQGERVVMHCHWEPWGEYWEKVRGDIEVRKVGLVREVIRRLTRRMRNFGIVIMLIF
jgi:hypothetical protein